MKTEKKILNKLISEDKSNWKEKAELRIANRAWLDLSARIALKILDYLRKKGISQKELAEKINVSPQQINKIVKGSENLTLQTISKIETALCISLIEVPGLQREEIINIQKEMPKTKYAKIREIISDVTPFNPLKNDFKTDSDNFDQGRIRA